MVQFYSNFTGVAPPRDGRVREEVRRLRREGAPPLFARPPAAFTEGLATRQHLALLSLRHNNTLVVGEAGSGKTRLIETLVDYVTSLWGREAIMLTASTACAASHFGGETLHSAIGARPSSTIHSLRKAWGLPSEGGAAGGAGAAGSGGEEENRHVQLWAPVRVLVIDEISMLECGFLSLVSEILKESRRCFAPFGGIRVVALGDFAQLPPVGAREMVFESGRFATLFPRTVFLDHQWRAVDPEFRRLLAFARYHLGNATPEQFRLVDRLATRYAPQPPIDDPRMFAASTNAEVTAINAAAKEAARPRPRPRAPSVESEDSEGSGDTCDDLPDVEGFDEGVIHVAPHRELIHRGPWPPALRYEMREGRNGRVRPYARGTGYKVCAEGSEPQLRFLQLTDATKEPTIRDTAYVLTRNPAFRLSLCAAERRAVQDALDGVRLDSSLPVGSRVMLAATLATGEAALPRGTIGTVVGCVPDPLGLSFGAAVIHAFREQVKRFEGEHRSAAAVASQIEDLRERAAKRLRADGDADEEASERDAAENAEAGAAAESAGVGGAEGAAAEASGAEDAEDAEGAGAGGAEEDAAESAGGGTNLLSFFERRSGATSIAPRSAEEIAREEKQARREARREKRRRASRFVDGAAEDSEDGEDDDGSVGSYESESGDEVEEVGYDDVLEPAEFSRLVALEERLAQLRGGGPVPTMSAARREVVRALTVPEACDLAESGAAPYDAPVVLFHAGTDRERRVAIPRVRVSTHPIPSKRTYATSQRLWKAKCGAVPGEKHYLQVHYTPLTTDARALTIHKLQGFTLEDGVVVFTDTIRSCGTLYVALSRARRLGDVTLVGDPKRLLRALHPGGETEALRITAVAFMRCAEEMCAADGTRPIGTKELCARSVRRRAEIQRELREARAARAARRGGGPPASRRSLGAALGF